MLICHAGLRIPLWLRHRSSRLYVVFVTELSKTIVFLFLMERNWMSSISSGDIVSMWHFMSFIFLPHKINVLSVWLSLIFCVKTLRSILLPNSERYSEIDLFTTAAFSFLKLFSHFLRCTKNGLTS